MVNTKKIFFLQLLFLCLVFIGLVFLKQETFGKMPMPGDPLWRNLTMDMLSFIRNWQVNGLIQSKFAGNFEYLSIESWSETTKYLSYPIGYIFVPYLLFFFRDRVVFFNDIMVLSLAWWLLSAILVMIVVSKFSEKFEKTKASSFFILLSGLAVLLTPGSVLFFQNIWWGEVVYIPFYCLLLLRELYPERKIHRVISFLFALVCASMDWSIHIFLWMLAFVGFRKTERKSIRWEYALASLAYGGFHFFLIYWNNVSDHIIQKILERSGIQSVEHIWSIGFYDWILQMNYGLGFWATCLFFLIILVLFVHILFYRKVAQMNASLRDTLVLLQLLTAPVFIYFLLFHQHFYEHNFNILRFILPLSIFLIGVFPIWLLSVLREYTEKTKGLLLTTYFGMFLFSWCLEYKEVFYAFQSNPVLEQEEKSFWEEISLKSDKHDLYFSPQIGTIRLLQSGDLTREGDRLIPVGATIAGKEIYLIRKPEDLLWYSLHLKWKRNIGSQKIRLKGIFWSKPKGLWKELTKDQKPIWLDSGALVYEFPSSLIGISPEKTGF
ncbi:MAG: hypothetical protein M9962_01545 [Oligoflexia bacterium]|nr:hypothetical protein [Oligoflexia bacterium]